MEDMEYSNSNCEESAMKKYLSGVFAPLLMILVLLNTTHLYSSNLSDATALREKCESEVKVIEIAVKNFGEKPDVENFEKGVRLIKTGKVRFIQSKYPEAIDKYKQYLKLQYHLYESLAKKYTARTEKIVNAMAEDLVDYIDNKKVEQYFRLANQNLKDAKSNMNNNHFKNSVDLCRAAKNYAIKSYGLVGKKAPDKYKKDLVDIDGKIFK